MITENPAANCMLSGYGLREGQRADFAVLNAQSPAQAVLNGGGVLFWYANGIFERRQELLLVEKGQK